MKTIIILSIALTSLGACVSPSGSGESAHNEQKCKDLRRQMDDLKGKPIRRSAAAERYKAECVN